MAEWQQELASELKTVLKGAEHDINPESLKGIIDRLESGDYGEAELSRDLRNARLSWFADRLDKLEFHNRSN